MHAVSELTLLRIERGLTIRDAAEQMGISKSTLGRLERRPSIQSGEVHALTAQRIARFYGLDVRELLDRCDSHAA